MPAIELMPMKLLVRSGLFTAMSLCFATAIPAAELVIVPEQITLTGRESTHRVLALDKDRGRYTGEVEQVAFSIEDESVATLEGGVVSPVGDGETTLTAKSADGRVATATIRVERQRDPFSWNFRNHVQPVLSKSGCNSGACHGAAAGQGGFRLSLRGYDPVFDHASITRNAGGRRITPADPARSLFLTKPTGAVPHKGGVRFETESEEYRRLAEWIAVGQPAPASDDAEITRLEILPDVALLHPGVSQQFIVRAYFTDGRVEDVTRWAKFSATDSSVAKVDDLGRASVEGYGEGSIVALYLSRNTVATIQSPYQNELAAGLLANSLSSNFIDDAVNAKLTTLGIPPSPPAGDAEFLRRAYLDTIGVLPTPEEVKVFLGDADPLKRTKVIDHLLSRPEFVDYWAYRWSDLFLVNSDKLSTKKTKDRKGQVEAYYAWIREQVAENTPWDQVAHQVLTASGSTTENGAANFYVLHQDPQDMAETVSMTFLGMAINCARCHDHPLEKWTNDQYYGLANLFARVRAKGNDDERVVFVSDWGDLVQPRTGKPQPPRPLDAEPVSFEEPADRREYLAQWLTSPENPYFAKAVINRVWANFFGIGIVEPVDDLRATNPPSNAVLFDALEQDFIRYGYDLRRTMRLILSSQTYQRSSVPIAGNEADTRYFSHYLPRRLKAEVLLDAVSQATLAPTKFPNTPLGTRATQLADVKVDSYSLDTFGRPDRLQTCECERTDMPSMKQVLHLLNGEMLNDKLARMADEKQGFTQNRIGQAIENDLPDEQIVEEAYLATLGRPPTGEERKEMLAALADVPVADRRIAVEDLYWGLMTSNEFLFQH